jgi:hypothetical protein
MTSLAHPSNTSSGEDVIPVDAIGTTCEQFVEYSKQFLSALSEIYPSCPGIKEARLQFNIAIEHAMTEDLRKAAAWSLVEAFHESMTPFYARLQARDSTFFAEAERSVDFLKSLSVSAKWEAADEDTRDCVYQYLDILAQLAQCFSMYKAIPSGMMSKIESMAMGIHQSGATLDNMNFLQLGQQVAGQIDQDDFQEFTQSVMGNPDMMRMMDGVRSQLMASMMGGAPPGQ